MRTIRSLWQRVRAGITRRHSNRITKAGLWYTITILLIGIGAFLSGNNLIFLILSALLATLLVSGNLNRLTLAGLEVDFHPPDHLYAEAPAIAHLVVRNTKSWFPSFALRLSSQNSNGLAYPVFLPMVGPRESLSVYARVTFASRGRYRDNGFQFSSRFPFGFAERRVRVTLLAEVLVYPAIDPDALHDPLFTGMLAQAEARRRGRGTEFYRLRAYESTDEARRIDWRASARHGELHLREFAVEEHADVVLVLDLAAWTAPAFEAALSQLATHAGELLAHDLNIRVLSTASDLAAPEREDLYAILKFLALVEISPFASGRDLEKLIADVPQDSLFLVYSPHGEGLPARLRPYLVTAPLRPDAAA